MGSWDIIHWLRRHQVTTMSTVAVGGGTENGGRISALLHKVVLLLAPQASLLPSDPSLPHLSLQISLAA